MGFLKQGGCPNGANCYFAHSMGELRAPPEMMQMMHMMQAAQGHKPKKEKKKEKKEKKEKKDKKDKRRSRTSDDEEMRGPPGFVKAEGERSLSPSSPRMSKKRKIEDDDF